MRAERELLGLTQTELTERLDTTQPTIARLETSGVNPSLDTLRRAANALGLALVSSSRLGRPPDSRTPTRLPPTCSSEEGAASPTGWRQLAASKINCCRRHPEGPSHEQTNSDRSFRSSPFSS